MPDIVLEKICVAFVMVRSEGHPSNQGLDPEAVGHFAIVPMEYEKRYKPVVGRILPERIVNVWGHDDGQHGVWRVVKIFEEGSQETNLIKALRIVDEIIYADSGERL